MTDEPITPFDDDDDAPELEEFDRAEDDRERAEADRGVNQATAYLDARATFVARAVMPSAFTVYRGACAAGFTKAQAFQLTMAWFDEETLDNRAT